jgi:hypothetical protein
MLRTIVFALTLNPSPFLEEGLLSGSPSPNLTEGAGDEGFFFSSAKNYSFQDGRGLKI